MGRASGARGRGHPRAGQELDVGRLLNAALDAFAENGYDGTSVRELNRRLGVSHGLLSARFGSKEALWFAAMEHAMAGPEESWRQLAETPGLDDLEVLRQGIILQVMFSSAYPQVVRILSHEGAIDSPRIRFIFERIINALRPLLEPRLNRLIRDGRIRPVSYATVHFLVVYGSGAPFANTVESALLGAPELRAPADLRQHAEAMADILVSGLAVPPT